MTEETKSKPAYRAVVGLNFPDGKGGERRVEAGTKLTATELKHANLAWYLEVGAVTKIGGE